MVVFDLDGVDAVDPAQNRVRVPLEVLVQLGQYLLDQLQLLIWHSLDYKSPIMAEKEEAPAGARRFSSLKNLIAIRTRVQRSVYLIKVYLIDGSQPLEYTGRIGRDFGPGEHCRLLAFLGLH